MKACERAMAVAMVAVMVMSAMVCILPATEDSDAAIDNKIVNLSDGQTKISTISVNDTAFDFTKEGDGVKIAYKVDSSEHTLYEYSIAASDENPTGSWAVVEGTVCDDGKIKADLNNTGYDLSIEPKGEELDGEYTFYFKGTGVTTGQSLTIQIIVISQGAEQYLEYPFTINVYKAFTSNDSQILYDSTRGTVGGEFSAAAPTVKYSNSDSTGLTEGELKNFAFYATGFNPGVGLRNDLSIRGSVPENLNGGWATFTDDPEAVTGTMSLTFIVTDTRTGYMVTIDGVKVSYELTSGPVVDFTITYTGAANVYIGSQTSWTADDADSTVTIVSNSAENALKISSKYSDNKATVVKTGNDGSTTVEIITLSEAGQSIDISGTGTIEIIVSVDGIDEKKITFIVIDDIYPINVIDVTCGPVVAQDSP